MNHIITNLRCRWNHSHRHKFLEKFVQSTYLRYTCKKNVIGNDLHKWYLSSAVKSTKMASLELPTFTKSIDAYKIFWNKDTILILEVWIPLMNPTGNSILLLRDKGGPRFKTIAYPMHGSWVGNLCFSPVLRSRLVDFYIREEVNSPYRLSVEEKNRIHKW